jgi:ADP-ribosylglycohydrolase
VTIDDDSLRDIIVGIFDVNRRLQRIAVDVWARQELLEEETMAKSKREIYALALEIDEVAAGSFKWREPPQIKGSGYAVRSLEAALWAFQRGDRFRDGALLAASLGDDADTTGAVYGQVAGA